MSHKFQLKIAVLVMLLAAGTWMGCSQVGPPPGGGSGSNANVNPPNNNGVPPLNDNGAPPPVHDNANESDDPGDVGSRLFLPDIAQDVAIGLPHVLFAFQIDHDAAEIKFVEDIRRNNL